MQVGHVKCGPLGTWEVWYIVILDFLVFVITSAHGAELIRGDSGLLLGADKLSLAN